MPVCFLCDKVLDGINGIQKHFRFVHKLDKYSPKYSCAEKACSVTYSSWALLRRDFRDFHHFLQCENASAGLVIVPSQDEVTLCDTNLNNCDDTTSDKTDVVEQCQTPDNDSFKEQLKEYACKLVA